MTDPLLQWVLALALALLFGAAAWHKRSAPLRFAAQLEAYGVVPPRLVRPAAVILPWLELATALLLLVPATRPAAAVAALVLLLAYAAAMLVNLRRGRTDIDCGCGGPAQPLSNGLVLRNLFLAAAAACLLQPAAERAISAGDLFLLILLLAPVILVYATIGQLFHNAGALRGWSAHES